MLLNIYIVFCNIKYLCLSQPNVFEKRNVEWHMHDKKHSDLVLISYYALFYICKVGPNINQIFRINMPLIKIRFYQACVLHKYPDLILMYCFTQGIPFLEFLWKIFYGITEDPQRNFFDLFLCLKSSTFFSSFILGTKNSWKIWKLQYQSHFVFTKNSRWLKADEREASASQWSIHVLSLHFYGYFHYNVTLEHFRTAKYNYVLIVSSHRINA